MTINVLKPKYKTEEILEALRECFNSGWTGMGNKTVEFENVWKTYSDFENALFVNSATSGLHLAVSVFKKMYNWNDYDEIITTPLTFVSSNHAILYENLTPVFADVDDQLCLDPTSVEQSITARTKAIMFVGLGGNIGQYKKIKELCDKHNLKLILDAAHMAGTKIDRCYHGVAIVKSQIGWDADATIFSFQAVKNLPTADSGMVCFRNSDCDNLARQLSWLGINKDTYARTNNKGSYKWDYDVPNVGYKYNGNSIMATIALTQIKYIDEDNAWRRCLSEIYENHLIHISNIRIIKHSECCKSSRHLFQIIVEDRESFLEHLYAHNIYPGVHYKSNRLYSMYKDAQGKTPYADHIHDKIVSLPLHLELTSDDVVYICNIIKKYYE